MTTQADPATVATTVVELLRAGRFDELAELFAPALAAAVSADTVRVGWAGESAKAGAIRSVGAVAVERLDEARTRAVVPVHGERGGFEVRVSVDDAGRLHGLRLAPAGPGWEPPGYAVPRRFTEREITLDCESLSVPGTVTLPRRARGVPGVVLIASGAGDRDVTVGPNKPFKDLAWGLASRGVAVLRFDKVTHVHTDLEHRPGFTMVEEYLPNVLAAVRLLRRQPGVDPDRVFLAGHSGGGKAALRAAAADASIAGVALLAVDTVPLPRAAERTFGYLAGLDPDAAANLTAAAETIARTEDPALSPETPGSELLFGWPASYWLDLREFDQVSAAAALDRPILVLQGGRDYQVTEADDLPAWRAGLAGRPGVTIRVLPADDHLFFPGSGPSSPADYQAPHHVDPAAVDALATWLSRGVVRKWWWAGRRR
ncbi:alpha/beta hydrolase [Nocardia blacklockiae]|uniref:alpha/beta hydrolase n=1 Tax=Nocardia blacklockiae TaxID=480036 RepID=UPI0018930E37|nr:alpha/beta hydrolase [Nocardia blacklockiae]MBF6170844.1 alpha/beta hydrolase [Nocardia blacklockiae]